MNVKRIAIVGCAVALIGAMTATAFAGTITGSGINANKGTRTALTAEQIAERTADREARLAERTAITEKWDALTDAEQAAVYQLHEDKINAEIAMIDKYLSLGLIDADRAAEMKTNLTERLANLETDGNMPMLGGHGGPGARGMGHGPGTPAAAGTTTTN